MVGEYRRIVSELVGCASSREAFSGSASSRRSPDRNVLEAMAHGMSSMVLLAANMLACLMALVAGMALLDSALVYLGTLLGWSFLGLNVR